MFQRSHPQIWEESSLSNPQNIMKTAFTSEQMNKATHVRPHAQNLTRWTEKVIFYRKTEITNEQMNKVTRVRPQAQNLTF